MDWDFDIGNIVSGGIKDIAEGAIKVIDEFVETPQEKAQAQAAIRQMQHEATLARSNEMTTTINKRSEVVVAELNQGDNYTKRARPTLVYSGLFFIFLGYFVAPLAIGEKLELPLEFWVTWGGVCSVWSIGRSAERVAPNSMATKLLNSTEPYKNAIARVIARGK